MRSKESYISQREIILIIGKDKELYYLEYNPINKSWVIYEAPKEIVWVTK